MEELEEGGCSWSCRRGGGRWRSEGIGGLGGCREGGRRVQEIGEVEGMRQGKECGTTRERQATRIEIGR